MDSSELGAGPSSSAARKVLKKIDRVIIPLLFVTIERCCLWTSR
jgi:hypothetical protein